METNRYTKLEGILQKLRCEKAAELQEKIRQSRTAERAEDLKGFCDAPADDVMKIDRIQHLSREMDAIDMAMGRLRQGAYGVCMECGEEIGLNRLQALPFAVRCKDCEGEIEEARRGKKK